MPQSHLVDICSKKCLTSYFCICRANIVQSRLQFNC